MTTTLAADLDPLGTTSTFGEGVSPEEWNDWKWQLRHKIRTVDQLKQFIHLIPEEEAGLRKVVARYPMSIPPYYASLMDPDDPTCPIRQLAVPSLDEVFHQSEVNVPDSLNEDEMMPVPNLVHRYPDRVLLIATDFCSMYCRHCTRKRLVGQGSGIIPKERVAAVVDYLRRHAAVRDIIISGGDPLFLPEKHLEYLLQQLRSVETLEIIRIGTRVPVTLPMRITPELVAMLSQYHPLWINTHFNHPKEITPEAARACDLILRGGIPLNNQAVLLKGVNDCPYVQLKLVHDLMKIRVRPYYLYQCDLVHGADHFRTPLSRGMEIIEALRGHTSGLAVPTFVVDAPGGGGKIPLQPNYLISQGPQATVLRNFEGRLFVYPEPEGLYTHHCRYCQSTNGTPKAGVARMLERRPEPSSFIPLPELVVTEVSPFF